MLTTFGIGPGDLIEGDATRSVYPQDLRII
jgi:hypothetical protein